MRDGVGHLFVRVAAKWETARHVMAFRLVAVDGELPSFTAGSHIDVHLPNGLIRQYSLCNGPRDTSAYLLGVKREPASRGGSTALHDRVKEGDVLKISLPRNNFPLIESKGFTLLLGGGIGVTPLLAMTQSLERDDRPYHLHYFARGSEDIAFRDILEGPIKSGTATLHLGVEAAQMNCLLTELLRQHRDDQHVYSCGPAPFMEAVKKEAAQVGPSTRAHFEYFQAEPLVASGNKAFDVRFARSHTSCTVSEHETIVSAAARVGVHVEVSCEQGVCGTCLTKVLAGEPEHRDAYLTPAECAQNDQMLPCVSRSKGPGLTLDL